METKEINNTKEEKLFTAYFNKFNRNVPNAKKNDLKWIKGQLENSVLEFIYTDEIGNESQARIENGMLIFHNHIKIPISKLADIFSWTEPSKYAETINNFFYSLMYLMAQTSFDNSEIAGLPALGEFTNLKVLADSFSQMSLRDNK